MPGQYLADLIVDQLKIVEGLTEEATDTALVHFRKSTTECIRHKRCTETDVSDGFEAVLRSLETSREANTPAAVQCCSVALDALVAATRKLGFAPTRYSSDLHTMFEHCMSSALSPPHQIIVGSIQNIPDWADMYYEDTDHISSLLSATCTGRYGHSLDKTADIDAFCRNCIATLDSVLDPLTLPRLRRISPLVVPCCLKWLELSCSPMAQLYYRLYQRLLAVVAQDDMNVFRWAQLDGAQSFTGLGSFEAFLTNRFLKLTRNDAKLFVKDLSRPLLVYLATFERNFAAVDQWFSSMEKHVTKQREAAELLAYMKSIWRKQTSRADDGSQPTTAGRKQEKQQEIALICADDTMHVMRRLNTELLADGLRCTTYDMQHAGGMKKADVSVVCISQRYMAAKHAVKALLTLRSLDRRLLIITLNSQLLLDLAEDAPLARALDGLDVLDFSAFTQPADIVEKLTSHIHKLASDESLPSIKGRQPSPEPDSQIPVSKQRPSRIYSKEKDKPASALEAAAQRIKIKIIPPTPPLNNSAMSYLPVPKRSRKNAERTISAESDSTTSNSSTEDVSSEDSTTREAIAAKDMQRQAQLPSVVKQGRATTAVLRRAS